MRRDQKGAREKQQTKEWLCAFAQHIEDSIVFAACRDWVDCLAALAVDKHLEVRRTAEQALATVHRCVDASVVRELLDAVDLASDVRTTLLQILQVLLALSLSLLRTLVGGPFLCVGPSGSSAHWIYFLERLSAALGKQESQGGGTVRICLSGAGVERARAMS